MRPLTLDINEMANMFKQHIGLNCVIWIKRESPLNKGNHNLPYVKVKYNNNWISYSIEDEPEELANGSHTVLPPKLYRKLLNWIKINKGILIEYFYSNPPMDDEELKRKLKRI